MIPPTVIAAWLWSRQPPPVAPAPPDSAVTAPASVTAAQPASTVPDGPAAHATAANNPAAGEQSPELDRAVATGLAALARMQNPDGSYGQAQQGRTVAVTALASIAFMADGNIPGRGAYAEQVAKGLNYILANCNENGLIATASASSPMYGHGFATLFLGEIDGMTQGGGDSATAQRVNASLIRAVRLIEATQNDEGGWRYNPVRHDADISVTICQIMALRSARNAGLDVPKGTIDRAVAYVRACQNPDGGFRYQSMAGPSAWPRSAAGIASLQYAGIYEDRAIDTGVGYLFTNAMPGRGDTQAIHYFYGHYYAVQACFLAGGKTWSEWWPAIRKELMDSQQPDGLWADPSAGEDYGTAMSLIILQMPKRYLPIFQK